MLLCMAMKLGINIQCNSSYKQKILFSNVKIKNLEGRQSKVLMLNFTTMGHLKHVLTSVTKVWYVYSESHNTRFYQIQYLHNRAVLMNCSRCGSWENRVSLDVE